MESCNVLWNIAGSFICVSSFEKIKDISDDIESISISSSDKTNVFKLAQLNFSCLIPAFLFVRSLVRPGLILIRRSPNHVPVNAKNGFIRYIDFQQVKLF